MALQSNADRRLISGLLPVSTVVYLSFQFAILHLLISVQNYIFCFLVVLGKYYGHVIFLAFGQFESLLKGRALRISVY